LGSALCAAGEARKAVEPIEAAWELRRALGDEFGQIAVLRLLGEALHAIGDHRSAAARMAEADQLNDRFGEAPRSQR
jgi:hypothetical protein